MNYMMPNYGMWGGSGFGSAFLLVILWSLFWKGLSLWHSSQRKQGWWFIALLVLNTVGILDIIYLFLVAKVPTSDLIPKMKKGGQNGHQS